MEIEDQSEDKDKESYMPADKNGKNEVIEEDKNIYDLHKVFSADNKSENAVDKDDNNHNTIVADLDINKEDNIDSSKDNK